MTAAPIFQSPFLEEVSKAFGKRRKALRHRVASSVITKAYELVESQKMERLELVVLLSASGQSPILRLHAWPDRMLWLHARQESKTGIAWQWTLEGRWLGNLGAADLAASFEATCDALPRMTSATTEQLQNIWRTKIAQGPSEIC